MRTRSIFRLILSLSLVALLSQAFVHVSAQAQPGVPSLDIVLVTDESSTIWQTNDTSGWRIVMDDLFIDMLGVDQSGASHQLTAVLFGNDATLVQPLSIINDQVSEEKLKQAILTNNTDMGGTNFVAALTTAYAELAKDGRPDAKKVIVFLTDGHCELQFYTTDEGTTQCNQNVRKLVTENADKARIYSIAFTAEATQQDSKFSIYKSLLQEISSISGGKYFEAPKSNQDLLNVYMAIIQDLMGVPPSVPPTPVTAPTTVSFDVSQGIAQIIITAVKFDAGITTTVYDPTGKEVSNNGSDIRYATSGRTDVYSINNPQAGKWKVALDGQGTVSVQIINVGNPDYKIDLRAPVTSFPAGKPMVMLVKVVDNQGKTVNVDGLKASVTLDGQPAGDLDFSPLPGGIYQSTLADTQKSGTYGFAFTSQPAGSGGPVVNDTKTVLVVKAPWIKILDPQPNQVYPVNQPLNVRVQMMFETDPVAKPEASDILKVNATVSDDQMNKQGDGQLKVGADGIFTLPFNFTQQFTGLLSAVMTYHNSTSGEDFTDTDEVSFKIGQAAAIPSTPLPAPTRAHTTAPTLAPKVTLPPTATATPPPPPPPPAVLGVIFAGLLVLLGAGGVGFWYWSKPALVGMVTVGSLLVPLSGKKPFMIGSDPTSAIKLDPEEGILARHAQLRPIGGRKNPQVEIVSLDPNNPVSVNGLPTPSTVLNNGDKIDIGNNQIEYTGPQTFEESDFTQPTDLNQTYPGN